MAFTLGPFWRGHLFQFDAPPNKAYDSKTGLAILIIVIAMEGAVRRLLFYGSQSLGLTDQAWWQLTYQVLLIAIVFLLLGIFTKLKGSELGLYPWRRWSATEKLYFLQIVPIAIGVFGYFSNDKLKLIGERPDVLQFVLLKLLPLLAWGFYQELVYRGLLQTELVRRWGAGAGIVASNLIFTFGPLHFYHFRMAQQSPSHLWIFAATFAIGLFFAVLYRRSGNLWMVGIFHGIGDVFLVGVAGA